MARQKQREREAAKNSTPTPEPLASPGSQRLLCQSKLRTLDTVLRLALVEAGVVEAHRANARGYAQQAQQRKGGRRPKPFRPKVYESQAPHLRLRTSQASLAMTAGCDVRTIQRHLDDMEAIGVVLVRKQLAPDKYRSPTFELLLDASYLEWEEMRVYAHGTTVQAGAENGPTTASASAGAPDAPGAGPEPPGGPPSAPDALAAVEALRKKWSETGPQARVG